MSDDRGPIAGADDGPVIVTVHVQPRAARTAVGGRHGDALKVTVTAPPTDGRANEAVAELLARTLGVRPSAVTLVGGATSRVKRYAVRGMPRHEVEDRLL